MKIGLIRPGGRLVTGPGFPENWRIHNFKIAYEAFSNYDLMHSAFSTPGRYLAEIFRRLNSASGQPILIVNPLIECWRVELSLIFKRLVTHQQLPAILVDGNGIPAVYMLPPTSDDNLIRRMALVSCVDGALDAAYLEKLFGVHVSVIHEKNGLHLHQSLGNGFVSSPAQLKQHLWVTHRALSTLQQHPSAEIWGLLPYHAGDLLFFSLAYQRMGKSFINGLVVARPFRDIVSVVAPHLPLIELDLPSLRSGGEPLWDEKQFTAIVENLPSDRCYYNFRPCRDYDVANFHLLDQYAFAQGYDGVLSLLKHPNSYTETVREKSVLLHFDGGWPLKVYPIDWQQQLIDILLSRGYEITVLGQDQKVISPNYRRVQFTNLAELERLIRRHSVLVGMDSFPCHYAAHVLGAPSICLFASTQPANSNALPSPIYEAIERGLPCRPCRAYARCPRKGVLQCENFESPVFVANAVEAMRKRNLA